MTNLETARAALAATFTEIVFDNCFDLFPTEEITAGEVLAANLADARAAFANVLTNLVDQYELDGVNDEDSELFTVNNYISLLQYTGEY